MRQNPNKILSTSFLKGLEEYNLTPEDIEQSKWRYCGGNKESRLKYWKLTCPKDDLPEHIDKCVCGVKIVEINVYKNLNIIEFVVNVKTHIIIELWINVMRVDYVYVIYVA